MTIKKIPPRLELRGIHEPTHSMITSKKKKKAVSLKGIHSRTSAIIIESIRGGRLSEKSLKSVHSPQRSHDSLLLQNNLHKISSGLFRTNKPAERCSPRDVRTVSTASRVKNHPKNNPKNRPKNHPKEHPKSATNSSTQPEIKKKTETTPARN